MAISSTARTLAAVMVFVLAKGAGAQNALVQNGDFESWVSASAPMSGQQPVDWDLQWTANGPPTASMTTQSTSTVHCGGSACQVDVQSAWCQVGKQFWSFPSWPAGAYHARVRVLYPTAPNQPSLTTSGTMDLLLHGYSAGSWSPLPGSSSVAVSPSDYWQEVLVSYSPQPGAGTAGIRLCVQFANGDGQRYYLDSVDFSGSDPAAYGSVPEPLAKQIRSSSLSLIYDGYRHAIRELRRVAAGVAYGPNYVDQNSSIGGSRLFLGCSRTTLAGTPTWFDSGSHSIAISRINGPAGRNGWKFSTSGGPVDATVDVYVEGNGQDIVFDSRMTPNNVMLEEFQCPLLQLRPYLGGPRTESTLVTPIAGGVAVTLNASTLAQVASQQGPPPGMEWFAAEYPGAAALQLISFYTADDGIALMAQDDKGDNKVFSARVDGISPRVDLTIAHRLPSVVGSGPVQGFRRVLLACPGDWRIAATRYRDWIRTTSLWSAASSRVTADWVAQRPTVFEASLLPQGIGHELVPLADWDDLMDDWRAQLLPSAPMAPLFRHFEKNGIYMGGDYLPLNVLGMPNGTGGYQVLHNQASILSAWTSVHNAGHRPMAMVAGLKWAANNGANPARAELSPSAVLPGCPTGQSDPITYWVPAHSNPVLPPNGSVAEDRLLQRYLDFGGGWSWDFSHYEMDPRHSLALSTHVGLATTMASGGLDLYLFDQMNGGHVVDNFSAAFPVSDRGAGRWKALAVRNLFAATKAAGKAVNADFELTIEDPCEQAIDVIAVHGIRPGHMRVWPTWGESQSVPMFSWVYNEVVDFVTWDFSMPTEWGAATQSASVAAAAQRYYMVALARCLCSGSWLATGPVEWMLVREYLASVPGNPCATPAGQAMSPLPARMESVTMKFLQACVRTGQGPGAAYLNFGKSVSTTGLGVPPATLIDLTPYHAGLVADFLQPQVFEAAWELPNNHWALLLVNADPINSATVTLPLSVGGFTLYSGAPLTLHVDGGAGVPLVYSLTAPHVMAPGQVSLITM